MGDEPKRSPVTVALLVLAGCHLALALSELPPPYDDDTDQARRVEPVGYLASVASTVLAAYVAAAACRGRGRRRLSVEALLAEVARTWARPAATALYIELLTTAMASLLLTLRAFLSATGAGGAAPAAGLVAASGSVALVAWLGPVLFAHSDIACRMSLLVAAAEEGYGGAAAVRRAEALVAGRRARGVAIGLMAGVIEQAPVWLCGDRAPALVLASAVLAAKIAACCACATFYYDCRRRHDKTNSCSSSRLKPDGMATCCQTGWDRDLDMGEETELEEFCCAFECFRLT